MFLALGFNLEAVDRLANTRRLARFQKRLGRKVNLDPGYPGVFQSGCLSVAEQLVSFCAATLIDAMRTTRCFAIIAFAAILMLGLAQGALAVNAIGGDIKSNYTLNGTDYVVHIFTTVGVANLSITSPGEVEILVVAGGGGSGGGVASAYGPGGGGAGGLVWSNAYSLPVGNYQVIVGAGGGGGPSGNFYGMNGANSIFDRLTAYGGGGGAGNDNNQPYSGAKGGSGGGGSRSAGLGGAATNSQGNAGGKGYDSPNAYGGGGGGGASANGGDGSGTSGGTGGAGVTTSILGASLTYAVGGNGGIYTTGVFSNGAAGAANTGNGGKGGSTGASGAISGGAGGSGIVIVRYYISGMPELVNVSAVVSGSSVTLNGSLISVGQDSNVLAGVFWGTTDAGNNMAGWTYANWFSGWSTVGPLSTNVALPGPAGARYFYRFFASNSFGSAWAIPVGSFSSLGAPSINNAGGVTDMGFFSATLNGEVLGGNPMPFVRIYWGRVNQGINKALWEHEILIDEFSSWAFAATIEGLTPDVTYFYICHASNSYGEAWSPMAMAFTPGVGKVHYVDKANPFPGSPYLTWANAATNIQAAIDVAVDGELVLVTNGVYNTGGRVAASMTNRVAITNAIIVMAASTNPSQTTIAGAPDPGTGGVGPAAIRGVYVGPNAQLIGFTVSNGCTVAGQYGGGVYAAANSIVRNCVITTNQAVYGGGIYGAANSIISNCAITSNNASSGGGIYVDAGVVSGCEITANIASGGAGVYGNANSIIRNCNIYSNQGIAGANNYGGGVHGGAYYNCRIISNGRVGGWTVGGIEGGAGGYGGSYYNCHIISNIGNYAAGLRSPTIVQDCEIRGNAGNNGGGGFGDGSIYTRCRISENTASQGAGGVCGEYSVNPPTTLLVNCLIFSNSVWSGGGGCGRVIAVNCTIYGNNGGNGGGFSTWGGYYGTSYVTNCIVISNGVMNFGIGTYYVGHTCTTTNTGTFPGAVNIITNNPMFVDPTTNDFRIVRTSPCFNTGINQDWMVNSVDLDGNPRICNFNVDMGAYEYFRPQGTIFTILGTPAP